MSTITESARKAGDAAIEKAAAAREAATSALGSARDGVTEALVTTKARAAETLEAGKARAEAAYAKSRAKADKALITAKKGAAKAGERTGAELENNPLAFIAGGIAIGALIASLLPGTAQEEKLLGTTGKKIKNTAKNAAKAARAEGSKKLESLGISKDAAKAQFDTLLNLVTNAASEAGSAATKAAAKAAKKR